MHLMNAPYILSELSAALQKLVTDGEPTTLYLSQFPMTEEDAAFLSEFLGQGPTFIEMQGTTLTRFRETSFPGVWWGEYYSQPGRISLRTIEVGEVPELVCATHEDMADAVSRLAEKLPEAVCTKPE